ncbi:MAG: hypothetical protein Q8P54_01205, partial [bacterium]|nr:hypothetical protein [bacterium]
IKYPITHTWHPNKWHFRFDEQIPEDIREFIMTPIVPQAQTLFFANGSQYAEGAVYLTNKTGNDIGRGFAESVQYADTTENMLRLAGLPATSKILDKLKPQGSSLISRFSSLCYMLVHQKDLKKVLGNAKGLEFFAKPKQKKQHVPRH